MAFDIKRAAKNYCSVESWKNRFPITKWLPLYSTSFLVSDILAGLTVGLMVIPQSLAYASVAKLPIQVFINIQIMPHLNIRLTILQVVKKKKNLDFCQITY